MRTAFSDLNKKDQKAVWKIFWWLLAIFFVLGVIGYNMGWFTPGY